MSQRPINTDESLTTRSPGQLSKPKEPMLVNVNSDRVLVTGASRGIGRAITKRLAQRGWQVAIHYNSAHDDADSLAREIGDRAAGVYSVDLGRKMGPSDLWRQVLDDGPVDAVVNNAGIYRPISFLDSTDGEFELNLSETFRTNWDAPLRLSRLAALYFASRGSGKILNVASRVGFRGESGAALYSASKAALINLTRALAVELAPKRIQVFGIAPGWVETAMARDGMQERVEKILETIPLGRMASPEDCASATSYLLSREAEYLSGVVLDINGASYFH